MKFVVGLGNPGRKYNGTPHNVGFETIDRLATSSRFSDLGGEFRARFKADYLERRLGDEKVYLIKPLTYMNLSGHAVQSILGYFRGTREDLLVVADDIDLPLGKLRFRARGSSGGHRGLASIAQALGGDVFDRLKIGVSPPEGHELTARRQRDAASYVLARFAEDLRDDASAALDRSTRAVESWIEHGLDHGAQEFN